MRIGIVAPEFPPQVGGIEAYSYGLAKELARRGHEVTVFSTPTKEKELTNLNFRIIRELRLQYDLDLNLLLNYQFEVLHCTNACYSWLANEIRNVVVSVHGKDFLSPYFKIIDLKQSFHLKRGDRINFLINKLISKQLIRKSLPKVYHIFTNSHYTEQVVLKFSPACQGKTSVARVGIAEEFFDLELTSRKSREPVRFITVSRLSEPRKNIDLVLRALAQIKDKFNFEYTVIGEGELMASLKKLAQSLKLEQKVYFRGRLSDSSLRELLCSSDLFILPSSVLQGNFEGFGIVYLEANACGVPVLALRAAGAQEAIKEGVSGFFIEEPTAEQLSGALKRFLSGEIIFSSHLCKEYAKQFTWANVVDHCLQYYPK